MLGGSLVSWKSKTQPTVALSSAKAEYRSMRAVTTELAWLTRLFLEFQVPSILTIPIKSDSLAAIYIVKNVVFHERIKHGLIIHSSLDLCSLTNFAWNT